MINWSKVYKLEAKEFSEDPDKYAEPELIYSLGKLRKLLDSIMRPSPVSGALARLYGKGTSQHYAIGRKSTASDVFIEGIPFEIYSKILYSKLFTGIGIYLDTNGPDGLPWVMFHLDIRQMEYPFVWISKKMYDPRKRVFRTYYKYPSQNQDHWKLLNDKIFFNNKMFGVNHI